ncbi:cyclophane-forming radical SAM/SPASM peptide maturase GrrM/OscB [Saccharospirillum mangrovi]|uniref:cyclophane-forming radical SAM/SPASM peptide maturase GrrM/OscB n=1 Tax=Saccharospirillum mangrovi TaxID=2161747 RepID=UPI000D3BC342|nr:cyclophane-forming radical SAM/SPASM peptide maturase GrrM/OscB [Saccharospirillum mangrovi]
MKLIVVQPTSFCNINCSYCYVPNRSDKTRMSKDTLENLFSGLFGSAFLEENESVEFLWHSGEPLVVGLPFYREVFELIEKYNKNKNIVVHSFQTNGLLLNEDWCNFFRTKKVNVGFSIDGPEFLHDINRVGWNGKGTHREVMEKYCLLRSNGISSGALCVLTREHLRYPKEILNFFVENRFPSVGFNVEEIENANTNSSLGIRVDLIHSDVITEFREFVSEFYDLWLPYSGIIDVREFQDFFNVSHKKILDPLYRRTPDEVQDFGIVTVQKDGSLSTYSPEFAGAKSDKYSDFVIGNVHRDTFSDISSSKQFLTIKNDMDKHKENCENSCQYFDLCGGSYASNVFFETSDLTRPESTACRLLRKTLYDVLLEKLASTQGNIESGFSIKSSH